MRDMNTEGGYTPTVAAMRALHVLLLEPEGEGQRDLVAFLRAQGQRVSLAHQGVQGLHKAVMLQPDVVLLDARLSDMDGFAVCRLLKQDGQTQHIPVLFLTHAQSDSERLRGLEAGAVDYLPRTISAREVLLRLNLHFRLACEARNQAPILALADPEPLWKQLWPHVSSHPRALPVRAALQYVQTRLGQALRLAEVAQAVGLGERQLSRLFQTHLGMSVFDAVRRLRMSQAQHLLRHTVLEVAEVGCEVGYPHAGNFATAFREQVGMTPTAYREQHSGWRSQGAGLRTEGALAMYR